MNSIRKATEHGKRVPVKRLNPVCSLCGAELRISQIARASVFQLGNKIVCHPCAWIRAGGDDER